MKPKIIIASGPVIIENGRVLLDISGRDEFWKFCGGKPGPDERLKETAIRRAKEELGITVEIDDKTGPYFFHTVKDAQDGAPDVILVHFLSRFSGEIKLGDDVHDVKWHPLDDLPENLAPNIVPALKHFGFLP